ncbi:hypothetical protein MRB53_020725 [Persea americana]|uniref:Uncharacterized protein n=1 Tax=Persea americana TaxID=3435 RepID=A0ACC2L332_PERAE|nr:hypothetical protein MRB53_020725 [Persea americana]
MAAEVTTVARRWKRNKSCDDSSPDLLKSGSALEEPAAIASLAPAPAACIEIAPSSGPYAAAGGAWVHSDGPSLAQIELFATARNRGGPNSVAAPICNHKCGCIGGDEDERESE